jgi:sulfur carrier protein ThiS
MDNEKDISSSSLEGLMRVRVERGKVREVVEVPEGSTSLEVLAQLRLLPDAHLVLIRGTPVPIDAPLTADMTLQIVKVASGG